MRLIRGLQLVVIFSFFFIILGCSNDEDGIKIEGYIFEVEEDRLLVVEDITNDVFMEIQGYSKQELMEEGGELIYLDYHGSDFSKGDRVEAWVNGIDTSYPAQASPSKIVKE